MFTVCIAYFKITIYPTIIFQPLETTKIIAIKISSKIHTEINNKQANKLFW